MRILLLDTETAPNTAFVWKLFKETIPLARLIESSYLLCFSAKWLGQSKMYFNSIHQSNMKDMLVEIHKLLDEADLVVHFNGQSFDLPVLNKEFLLHQMNPPSPYKQVDLLRVARKQFKFTSNKLDHIASELGLGNKHETNFELWVDCMKKDPVAWKRMEAYNKQDVKLLEMVYHRFLPWIPNHANYNLYGERGVCPNCGSGNIQNRGIAVTKALKYQRFQCKDCGTWARSGVKDESSPSPEDKLYSL